MKKNFLFVFKLRRKTEQIRRRVFNESCLIKNEEFVFFCIKQITFFSMKERKICFHNVTFYYRRQKNALTITDYLIRETVST